jgi:hypothetical protein
MPRNRIVYRPDPQVAVTKGTLSPRLSVGLPQVAPPESLALRPLELSAAVALPESPASLLPVRLLPQVTRELARHRSSSVRGPLGLSSLPELNFHCMCSCFYTSRIASHDQSLTCNQ